MCLFYNRRPDAARRAVKPAEASEPLDPRESRRSATINELPIGGRTHRLPPSKLVYFVYFIYFVYFVHFVYFIYFGTLLKLSSY